jgi:hypothetical protein
LPVQPGQSHNDPKAFTAHEIESDNFILRDAAEMPVRSKAQAAGLAEFGHLVRREDADEAAVQGIVSSNRRHGVRHAEWALAAKSVRCAGYWQGFSAGYLKSASDRASPYQRKGNLYFHLLRWCSAQGGLQFGFVLV